MAELADNIPTLTDIVAKGDENMLNHFDSQQFSQQHNDTSTVTHIVENASQYENIEVSESLDQQLNQIELSEDKLLDGIQLNAQPSAKQSTNTDQLKEKIDLAITELLPGIEAQLKKQLYKKFKL